MPTTQVSSQASLKVGPLLIGIAPWSARGPTVITSTSAAISVTTVLERPIKNMSRVVVSEQRWLVSYAVVFGAYSLDCANV